MMQLAGRCENRSGGIGFNAGRFRCNCHAMDDEFFAVERGECAGPGLEASPAIIELVGGAGGKIHAAVFAVEQRGEGGEGVVLRLGMNGSGGEAGQGFNHQRRAGAGELIEEIDGGLIGRDFDGLLEKNGAGVEAFFEKHGGIAGECVAHGHGPLDGRGAAVFGQQRGVQVDAAEAREGEHPGRNDAAVGDHDDGFGSDGLKLGAEFRVAANFFRLGDGQPADCAASLTAGAVSCCERPVGRSGCETARAMSWPAASSACSVGTANWGVPQKTSFTAFTTHHRAASCGSCADSGRA